MPSVFISYSHDPSNPTHEEHVAGLAASLMRDGLKVFLDANRGPEEERVPWPIWMEGKIEEADYVLLVCTELYLKKIRQEVPEDEGQGVCWEANIIYSLLYERKLNTIKFSPVLFSPADRRFIPPILKGRDSFIVDSQRGYNRLYAFVTDQHRIRFPEQGATLQTVARKTVQPFFAPSGNATPPARTDCVSTPEKSIPAATPQLTLKPNTPPVPRYDIRGLDWYDECDAGHFIGRSDDANQILGKLMPHPILRLIGPSGIGKSSLVRAGLLPKVRESGWRACVIRPFEDPAQHVPSQLTAELIASPGAFTTPLDPAKFRAEVSPLLSGNGINSLVLFFDQFEDIVSPVAASGAVDTMREFLRELWEQNGIKPYLRAVVVYRTDADMRLGRLWQEVSGRSEGLPYLALEGLSRSVAETIIIQTAEQRGWRLETSVPEIARQLALESQKLQCSDEIFPVYLQIFLKQAEQSTQGRITAEFIAGLGGVAGLIGKYLEQTLAKLKARGGEWEKCGAVLESLSRSGGEKATQSFEDLVRETGVSRAVLAEMLRELINERLVRPVGQETYEIQHDRLAAAVIESMKESDREAKAADEFLAAKAPAFEWTTVPLSPDELVYLYRHRQKIHPTERELSVLLASLLHNIEAGARNESPEFYWFRASSPQDFLRWFIQTEHWAAKGHSSFRPSRKWVKTFPLGDLESKFAALAADKAPTVRAICARLIGRAERDEDLPLLRKLVNDQDLSVRTQALEELASFSKEEDLPLLRQLATDRNPAVRRVVVEALGRFSKEQDLPLLRQLAGDSDRVMRRVALEALGRFSKEQDLPLLRQLARDNDWEVCRVALEALGRFSKEQDLPLLRQLAETGEWHVRCVALEALGRFSKQEDLPLLRQLAADSDWEVRDVALEALARFSKQEHLPLLRQLATDSSWEVRRVALGRLGRLSKEEDLPLLRQLAEDTDPAVRRLVVEALGRFSKEEDLPLLRQLARDNDWEMRRVALEALGRFSKEEDLPLLRQLAEDSDSSVRRVALEALGRSSKQDALPLFARELALAEVAAETVRSLALLCSREELEAFLNQHDKELCAMALAALDELLYMPEWMSVDETELDR
jgi:HEAT repeat protein